MADITNISVGGTSYSIKDAGAVRDVSGKANLASPTFTGTPAAPTASAGTNTTQIATTAFVQTAISGKAPTASPTFTGTPKTSANTSYTTAQLRNIVISTANPSGGSNGDVWIKYED